MNATARAVVHAHRVMADRGALREGKASEEAVDRYLAMVDTLAVEHLLKCKVVSSTGSSAVTRYVLFSTAD